MNLKKIKQELGIIKQRLTDKTTDEVRTAYFNQETNCWELYEVGETLGGKVAEYLADQAFIKRFRDYQGALIIHDRREC